jgi:hypothetical protein
MGGPNRSMNPAGDATMTTRSLVAALGLLALAGAPLSAQQAESRSVPAGGAARESTTTRRPSPAPAVSLRRERQIICRGAAIPTGWVLVDDLRDSSMCEGSNPAIVNAYNVWAIERYDNRPIGTMIEICAAAATPEGWVVVDLFRDRELCGHPDDLWAVNVKKVRRIK